MDCIPVFRHPISARQFSVCWNSHGVLLVRPAVYTVRPDILGDDGAMFQSVLGAHGDHTGDIVHISLLEEQERRHPYSE